MSKKNQIRLLIIDDNKVSRFTIRKVLENSKLKFTFGESWDSKTTLELINSTKFDCIILDYFLKDITGLELLEKFNEIGLNIPVIMLTGMGDEMLAVNAMKAGAYDYMPKKILMESAYSEILVNAIRRAIDLHTAQLDKERTRKSLETREERYRSLVENAPILILRLFPEDMMISAVTDGFCNYFKINHYEALGEDFFSFIPEEFHDKMLKTIKLLNKDEPIATFETYTKSDTEGTRWLSWTFQSLFDANDIINEYQFIGKDITQLKSAEIELLYQKKYLQSILDSQDNMLVVTDYDNILLANNSFMSFFGYDNFDDLSNNITSIMDVAIDFEGMKTDSDLKSWIDSVLKNCEQQNLIVFKPQNDEPLRIFSAVINKLLFDVDRYVMSFTDVTELEIKSKKFEKKASFDILTKIYNRQKFEEIYSFQFDKSKINNSPLSIIFFDIDHFKKINDTFGHDVGDSVLFELASLVKKNIRGTDFFARWGGEEFLILLPDTEIKISSIIAEKLRKLVSSFDFKQVKKITCSFGVSEKGETCTTTTIIKKADKALYKAKDNGRNRVAVFRGKK